MGRDFTRNLRLAFPVCYECARATGERRPLTTEKNIMKVIQPLFLDDLRAEFARLKGRRDTGRTTALKSFHEKLGTLTFFDSACGCGNFLIIAYRSSVSSKSTC